MPKEYDPARAVNDDVAARRSGVNPPKHHHIGFKQLAWWVIWPVFWVIVFMLLAWWAYHLSNGVWLFLVLPPVFLVAMACVMVAQFAAVQRSHSKKLGDSPLTTIFGGIGIVLGVGMWVWFFYQYSQVEANDIIQQYHLSDPIGLLVIMVFESIVLPTYTLGRMAVH